MFVIKTYSINSKKKTAFNRMDSPTISFIPIWETRKWELWILYMIRWTRGTTRKTQKGKLHMESKMPKDRKRKRSFGQFLCKTITLSKKRKKSINHFRCMGEYSGRKWAQSISTTIAVHNIPSYYTIIITANCGEDVECVEKKLNDISTMKCMQMPKRVT